jgi:transglutaminase-like putative cysteine protease
LRRLSGLFPTSPVEESAAARAFAFGACVVAAVSIALYGQDYVVPAAALAAAAAGHRQSWRRRHLPRGTLRQAVIAALVFACLLYVLADSVAAVFGGQLPQANFALLLVAVTSFDLKTRRNLYSSLWISLAVLYLAAVYAWDYQFGVLVAAWTACLTGFWIASHLRRLGATLRLPPRPLIAAGAATVLAGGLLFALAPQPQATPQGPLIISLPSYAQFQGEIENPALPIVQVGGDPSGSTKRVDLRYRGRLGDGVVMYVRTGAPAYWRGLVFDQYANGAWTASRQDGRVFPAYVSPDRLPTPEGPQLGTFAQVFRIVRPLPGVIYAANPVESLYFPAAEVRQDAYGAWRAPGPLMAGQTYSVVSYLPDLSPTALRGAEGPDPAGGEYLDSGALSSRARALALEVGKGEDRYSRVMSLTTYLQNRYAYTLQLGHVPPGEDPVDWFLFDARAGYCEQFATAETLMLRALGIPARLATGYATGDYDAVLNQAVVHESDAHAWVEAWFPGHGWVPIDPSPGYSALAATRFPNRWAGAGIASLIPHLSVGGGLLTLGTLGVLGVAPAALGLLAGLALALVWLWRRRWRRLRRPKPSEELLDLYDRLQQRLKRIRAPSETPLEYERAARGGTMEELLTEVTAAVNCGAYGGRWPVAAEVAAWRERLFSSRG